MNPLRTTRRPSALLALSAVFLLPVAGCKSTPAAPDDSTLASTVKSQISGDSALNGQSVQASVSSGVATLNGTVANDAQKAIAGRDAAGVSGIRQVMNNLTVQAGSSVSSLTPPPAPVATVPTRPVATIARNEHLDDRALDRAQVRDQVRDQGRDRAQPDRTHQPAPIERSAPPQQQAYNPPLAPVAPPAAQPVFRNVSVPSGSTIPVRITQTLDSATTQEGSSFSGTVASDILVDGVVAIPAGSAVSGTVDTVHEAAHFQGTSLLTISLHSVSRRGERLAVSAEPYSVEGKSRGKNTAEKAGIGAVGGAILGGIFGGGKGAAIGAAAGGGTGAGINAVTRGQQVQIPSETIVRFHLSAPVSTRVRVDADDHGDRPTRDNTTLQPR